MKQILIQFLLVTLFLLSVNTWGAEYYVSPDGSDANPGTKDKPFGSLTGARDAIRKLKTGTGLPAGGITVWVRGGQYVMKEPLVLGPEDSGSAEAPIRYEGFPKEGPVLTGAVEIDGWHMAGKDVPGIKPELVGKIQVADIPKGWRFHYLYCNDDSLPCSRSVSTDDWRQWPRDWTSGTVSQGGKPDPLQASADHTPKLVAVGDQLGWPITFGTPGVLNDTLPTNGDLEMFAIMRRYGITAHAVLTDLNPAAGTAVWLSNLTPPWPNQPRKKMEYEHCYRLENAVCFIDQEGEWAVDSDKGKVYCWQPEGTTLSNELSAPVAYNLIRLEGTGDKTGPCVHHIEIRNLTLQCTDRLPENKWPADWLCGPENLWENPDGTIYMKGVEDIVVDNCQITRPGAYGITLDRHAQRVTLTRNRIESAGSGGILLAGYGPGGAASDVNKNNKIERNYISDTGQAYWHGPGICVFSSGGNSIRYNIITKTPYSGIVMGDTLKAEQINSGAHHNRPMLPGQKIGNFDYSKLWRISWDELPAAEVEKIRAGAGDLTQTQLNDYLHNQNNLIENNVIADVHERFVEGGAIYSKYTGAGNLYHQNLIYSPTIPNSSIIAMDSGMIGSVLTDNVMWVDGPSGVIEAGGNTSAKGNVRVNLDPRGTQHFSRNGIQEGWWSPEASTQPFYALLDQIKATAAKDGGWPDGVDVNTLVPPLKAP